MLLTPPPRLSPPSIPPFRSSVLYRVCAGLRTCSSSQYVSQNHTATSDRVCEAQAAACADSEVEAFAAGPYQLRVCSLVYRSCSDIWRKTSAARANNGYYVVSTFLFLPLEEEEGGGCHSTANN